ncbi:uncharacterized protein YALI1_C18378g [Yarrowia lipolytica]|uniref:Uncharacterized protein n=1 Tax=Yarrowia lipolytica TaxID=4952 RepID=A0A1D8NAY1_YARLL|nr:hypothetical protein YALI1_C18378g [Yarrowia lipolytica]
MLRTVHPVHTVNSSTTEDLCGSHFHSPTSQPTVSQLQISSSQLYTSASSHHPTFRRPVELSLKVNAKRRHRPFQTRSIAPKDFGMLLSSLTDNVFQLEWHVIMLLQPFLD